jgi:hypothetical protein
MLDVDVTKNLTKLADFGSRKKKNIGSVFTAKYSGSATLRYRYGTGTVTRFFIKRDVPRS